MVNPKKRTAQGEEYILRSYRVRKDLHKLMTYTVCESEGQYKNWMIIEDALIAYYKNLKKGEKRLKD